MKSKYLIVLLTLCGSATVLADSKLTLHYDQPAESWQLEALPIGNGRLGAMVFSGVDCERIHFNEDSLWARTSSDIASFQSFGDIYLYLHRRTYAETPHYSIEPESLSKAFDGDPETRWVVSTRGHPGQRFPYVLVLRAPLGEPKAVTCYTLRSAVQPEQKGKKRSDKEGGTPKSWKLEGSEDGKTWVVLDRRRDEPEWKAEGEVRSYAFENVKPYRLYRLVFEKTHNGINLEMAEIDFPELDLTESDHDGYRRELNLANALHHLSYKQGGVTYRRECFASYPDQVLVFRFTADGKGAYNGRINLRDAHGGETRADDKSLTFKGVVNEGVPVFHRSYEARLRIVHDGGTVRAKDGSLILEKVDSFTILLAAGTDFLRDSKKGWRGDPPHKRLGDVLEKAASRSYAQLRQRHVEDYRVLFERVSLDLGKTPPAHASIPTNRRLAGYAQGASDPEFEALVFQFARYLMIASSRPDCNPANLQGLWNDSNTPAWQSDYHPDVNVEMNYWFVDVANLSECFSPFADWLDSIRETRREETMRVLKVESGWAFRSGTDIYGNSTWKWMKAGGAWCAQNLWDHYAFTQDQGYLERIYPILKELCEYWDETLKELPDGTMVAPDGWSPERGPSGDGVAHEQQLVWDLFGNYVQAAEILDLDPEFRQKIARLRGKLLGPQIGKWGQLQEWMEDIDRKGDTHRHLSHMMAVHPCNQISPLTTPELADAARVSLNARGDGGPGWSKSQKICLWARLHDGNRCHKLIRELLHPLQTSRLLMAGGGLFPNLLSGAPVLVDANFGYAAGICEMLVQSHMGEIHLLPALPNAWPKGYVKGLKARGNYIVDLTWDAGTMTGGRIVSISDGNLKVRAGVPFTISHGDAKISSRPDPENKKYHVATVKTTSGQEYKIRTGM